MLIFIGGDEIAQGIEIHLLPVVSSSLYKQPVHDVLRRLQMFVAVNRREREGHNQTEVGISVLVSQAEFRFWEHWLTSLCASWGGDLRISSALEVGQNSRNRTSTFPGRTPCGSSPSK